MKFWKIKTHFAEIFFFSHHFYHHFCEICTCPPTCIVFKETVHALFDYWIFLCIIYHENEIKCISTRNTFTCLIINLPQSSDIDGLILSFKFWWELAESLVSEGLFANAAGCYSSQWPLVYYSSLWWFL